MMVVHGNLGPQQWSLYTADSLIPIRKNKAPICKGLLNENPPLIDVSTLA